VDIDQHLFRIRQPRPRGLGQLGLGRLGVPFRQGQDARGPELGIGRFDRGLIAPNRPERHFNFMEVLVNESLVPGGVAGHVGAHVVIDCFVDGVPVPNGDL